MADIPKMSRIFAILLPKIFPMAMSVFPFILAKMLTMSSGVEVPNATMVSPMTRDDMPNFFAMEDAPSTSQSAPLIRSGKPMMNKIYVSMVGIFNYKLLYGHSVISLLTDVQKEGDTYRLENQCAILWNGLCW